MVKNDNKKQNISPKKNIGVCTLRIFHFLLFININAKKKKETESGIWS